jgi:hypothetical protein
VLNSKTRALGATDTQGSRRSCQGSGAAAPATHGNPHLVTSQEIAGHRQICLTDADNIRFWDIGKYYDPLPLVDKSIYSAEYQRLCELLRELRHEARLTQVQVAERLDEPQSFVSKYEAGERRLDVVELHQVGAALGVTVVAILQRLWPES